MSSVNRRDLILGCGALLAAGGQGPADAEQIPNKNSQARALRSFKPGAIWLDTAGKPIQAHGASIIRVGDLYYWYGENKERTDGSNGIWHWGVRCYSSPDLYNWDDLGLIIPPEPDNPSSPLHPNKGMDRPHILYNTASGKFVCWLKIMEDRAKNQTRAVLVADKITGPYRLVGSGIKPLSMNAGDFDLATNPDDAKAYMYFDRVHTEVICADLTDDYTSFTGYYSTHFPHIGAPLSREGPAYFRRNGKHYLATSGVTGYFPNPTEIAVAETFHGPWNVLGDLHPDDATHTSFSSQISSVFRHPGKRDLYIALADRWVAALSPADFEAARAVYEKLRQTPRPLLSREEIAALTAADMNKLNTSLARYVWLPVRFQDDRPIIEWHSEWSLDDYR